MNSTQVGRSWRLGHRTIKLEVERQVARTSPTRNPFLPLLENTVEHFTVSLPLLFCIETSITDHKVMEGSGVESREEGYSLYTPSPSPPLDIVVSLLFNRAKCTFSTRRFDLNSSSPDFSLAVIRLVIFHPNLTGLSHSIISTHTTHHFTRNICNTSIKIGSYQQDTLLRTLSIMDISGLAFHSLFLIMNRVISCTLATICTIVHTDTSNTRVGVRSCLVPVRLDL